MLKAFSQFRKAAGKCIRIRKKQGLGKKLLLLTNDMNVSTKYPKYTLTFLELVRESNKVAIFKNQHTEIYSFFYLTTRMDKKL